MSLKRAYRGGFEDRPGWWFEFRFDRDIIDRIKREIPASERERWWVSEAYAEALERILPAFAAFRNQPALF